MLVAFWDKVKAAWSGFKLWLLAIVAAVAAGFAGLYESAGAWFSGMWPL